MNICSFTEKIRVDVEDENVRGAYSALGSDWATTGYEVPYPFVIKAKAGAEYFLVSVEYPCNTYQNAIY